MLVVDTLDTFKNVLFSFSTYADNFCPRFLFPISFPCVVVASLPTEKISMF